MGELGSGDGSSYPTALDTNNTLEVNSPNANKTKARAEVPNDLAAAVVAIQTELGVDPAGTLSNVVTYLQTEHNADGTHDDITTDSIVNAGTLSTTGALTATGGIKTDGTNTLKTKIIDIGDWNMDTTSETTVAHGLTLANIRSIDGLIRNDADTEYFPFGTSNISGTEVEVHIVKIGTTDITFRRRTGGSFDNTTFDSTSYNRGWFRVTYIA